MPKPARYLEVLPRLYRQQTISTLVLGYALAAKRMNDNLSDTQIIKDFCDAVRITDDTDIELIRQRLHQARCELRENGGAV